MYIEENRQEIISPDSVPRRGVGGTANSFVGVQRTVGDNVGDNRSTLFISPVLARPIFALATGALTEV